MEIKANWNPTRYSEINSSYQNEVVMLRGKGCFHSDCSFCDYYLDRSSNIDANFALNKTVLDQVTGKYGELEVICSGSFQELDKQTLEYIKQVCYEKNIGKLSLECHWVYKDTLAMYQEFFANITVAFRIGVETFDYQLREEVLNKKMGDVSPSEIAKYFDYCNLIVGIKGQTREMIINDIKIANQYFKRVCIGVFEENSTATCKDYELVKWFETSVVNTLADKFLVLLNSDDYPLGDGCMSEVKK